MPREEASEAQILGRMSVQVKAPESNNGTVWISRFLGALWVDNSEVERTKILHADLSNEWVQKGAGHSRNSESLRFVAIKFRTQRI